MTMLFKKRVACVATGMLVAGWAMAQGVPAGTSVLVSGPAGTVTLAEVELMAKEAVPPAHRAAFWSNADAVSQLARSVYAQRVMAQDALQERLERDAEGAAYMELMRERALAELLMQQRVRARSPDHKAVQAYARTEFKMHPQRYQQQAEQVQVRHILLPVAKDGSDDAAVRIKAQALLTQLRSGADFAKLATEQSADQGSAKRGGDLGFFGRGRMMPPFDQAAFALQKKGDMSEPVRTNFGYHLIELLDRRPATTMTYEQALPTLREELLSRINTDERKRLWTAAESKAKVDDEVLTRTVNGAGR